ncbi:MAG: hypothetical protein ACI4UJ_05955 [Candidatus Cryptobacteroides sp.]
MKYRNIILAAAAFLLAGCAKDAIDPIKGLYPKPEDIRMTKLLSSPVEKLDKVRCFTVEIATDGVSGTEGNYTGTGSVLKIKFFGDKYYLDNATYTSTDASAVKKGFYLAGDGGSTFTRVNSGKAETVALDHGGISVSSVNGVYSISGSIWLANSEVIRLESEVGILYEPDPEPLKLVNVLSVSKNPGLISLQLAQEGIASTLNPDWSTSWSGEGYYLALDLYSPDGYLHEGTYNACATGGTVGEGEFGIGYDTTMDFGWGPMEMKDWGTCLWYVSNGNTTAQKVLSGVVTIDRDGNNWIIELKSGEGKDMLWTTFTGAIPELTDPGSTGEIKYKELSKCISAAQNTGILSLQFATDGVWSEFNTETYKTTYYGTGNYLAIDIYSADGKLSPGEYKACATGGMVGEGEFGIGYDTEMWGMQFFNWGTCWWTVEDGATSAEKVLDGTITVSVEGDVYTVALVSSTVNAKYIGTITL